MDASVVAVFIMDTVEGALNDLESAILFVYDVVYTSLAALAAAMDWAFTEYLLISNIVSAGLLLGLGDFIAQTIENILKHRRQWTYNFIRNRRTIIVGFVLGVFNHLWYTNLNHYVQGNAIKIVLKKIALDQAFAGPFFCTALFIGMGILERKTAYAIYSELKEKFIEVYKADWMFWPAAQFINFYLVAPRFQAFYVNFATLLWNTFLTFVKHRHNPTPQRSRRSNRRPHFRRRARSRSSTRSTRSRMMFRPISHSNSWSVSKRARSETQPFGASSSFGSTAYRSFINRETTKQRKSRTRFDDGISLCNSCCSNKHTKRNLAASTSIIRNWLSFPKCLTFTGNVDSLTSRDADGEAKPSQSTTQADKHNLMLEKLEALKSLAVQLQGDVEKGLCLNDQTLSHIDAMMSELKSQSGRASRLAYRANNSEKERVKRTRSKRKLKPGAGTVD